MTHHSEPYRHLSTKVYSKPLHPPPALLSQDEMVECIERERAAFRRGARCMACGLVPPVRATPGTEAVS